jgi:hypothetical protein
LTDKSGWEKANEGNPIDPSIQEVLSSNEFMEKNLIKKQIKASEEMYREILNKISEECLRDENKETELSKHIMEIVRPTELMVKKLKMEWMIKQKMMYDQLLNKILPFCEVNLNG